MVDSDLCLLSTFGGSIGLDELRCSIDFTILELEAGTERVWDRSLLKHNNGAEIAWIERYDVVSFELGARMNEIRGKAPARAANWLADFLGRVKTLYSFRCLPGARIGEAWREIDSVANYLWLEHGGIFQTSEGFTNEYGYHILFSSPDAVSGPRWTGLLQADGNWVHFKMDLGDSGRLEQFLRGELPEGVELARVGWQDPFEFYNPLEPA